MNVLPRSLYLFQMLEIPKCTFEKLDQLSSTSFGSTIKNFDRVAQGPSQIHDGSTLKNYVNNLYLGFPF